MSAAKTPEARARIAQFMREEWARRKHVTGFIDGTPALQARRRGFQMVNMAVLHESVNGSRQDAPVHEMTRHEVYVKVMASLRMFEQAYVASHGGMGTPAAFKEHTKDMVVSLPDDIVLHLGDLWDDGQPEACAELYMECMRTLLVLRGHVISAEREIWKDAA
jgi:DNA repair exonuclease SbcCD nuclease subunit